MIEVINTFDNDIVGFRFDGGINKLTWNALRCPRTKMVNDKKVTVYAEIKASLSAI